MIAINSQPKIEHPMNPRPRILWDADCLKNDPIGTPNAPPTSAPRIISPGWSTADFIPMAKPAATPTIAPTIPALIDVHSSRKSGPSQRRVRGASTGGVDPEDPTSYPVHVTFYQGPSRQSFIPARGSFSTTVPRRGSYSLNHAPSRHTNDAREAPSGRILAPLDSLADGRRAGPLAKTV